MVKTICTDKPVLVTGASGFIASHIVEMLLQRGYKVRGTVRNVSSPAIQYLRNMENASSNLELVELDLMRESGWREAAKGCEMIMHTASPFILDVDDPDRDLVMPAVNGVRYIMEAADLEKVKKVILTSSVAAISDDFENGRVYNEKDWNQTSNLKRNPYYYSKVMAEQTANEYMHVKNPSFKLACILPFATIGPSHRKQDVNQSVETFTRLLNGTDLGVAPVGVGYVDVRDVAEAHILAMENPDAVGRFIVHENSYRWPDIADMLRHMYPNHHIPRIKVPSVVTRAIVNFFYPSGQRDFVKGGLDKFPLLDNSLSKTVLGLKYRPFHESVKDCCDDLISKGHVAGEPKSAGPLFFLYY